MDFSPKNLADRKKTYLELAQHAAECWKVSREEVIHGALINFGFKPIGESTFRYLIATPSGDRIVDQDQALNTYLLLRMKSQNEDQGVL